MVKAIKTTTPKIKDIRKPLCPAHRAEMQYESSIGRWKCPELGCKFTATRKHTDDDDELRTLPPVKKAMAPKKPLQNYGPKVWALTIGKDADGDDQYWLSHESVSFAMDVTDYVETVIDDQTNSVTLCLLFNNVKRG